MNETFYKIQCYLCELELKIEDYLNDIISFFIESEIQIEFVLELIKQVKSKCYLRNSYYYYIKKSFI